MGGNAAEIFLAHGYKIIAMSDSKGGVINEAGLDIKALEAWKKETGALAGFAGSRSITNAELLELARMSQRAHAHAVLGHAVGRVGCEPVCLHAQGG